MIVIAAQLVGILLFSGVETNGVIVALKRSYDIGDLGLVDTKGYLNYAGLQIVNGIELRDLGIVGLYQLTDLAK